MAHFPNGRSILALALLLLPFACSSSQTSDTGEAPGLEARAVTEAQRAVCVARAQAYCARSSECSSFGASFLYDSFAGCLETQNRLCVRDFALPGNGQTLERLQACVASLPTAICAAGWTEVVGAPECSDVPGTLQAGSPCVDHSQCASWSCKVDFTTGCRACGAEPIRTAPLGAECSSTKGPHCAEGTCYGKKCVHVVQAGQPCDELNACRTGLTCRDGVCGGGLPEGADCVLEDECVFGFVCTDGKCVAEQYYPAGVGAPCGLDAVELCKVTTQFCAGPLAGAGTCQPLPVEGMPCGQGVFGEDLCARGLDCADGVCQFAAFDACQ